MSRNLYEPTDQSQISQNRYKIRDTRKKPPAGAWIFPLDPVDCPPTEGGTDQFGNITRDWTPCLLDGAKQPSNTSGLTKFAFRQNYDGSLEFTGMLDLEDSTSPAMVVVIPGVLAGDPDYFGSLVGAQVWANPISTPDFTEYVIAQFFLDYSTGELTITWPATVA